jgi:hypothetical protein
MNVVVFSQGQFKPQKKKITPPAAVQKFLPTPSFPRWETRIPF